MAYTFYNVAAKYPIICQLFNTIRTQRISLLSLQFKAYITFKQSPDGAALRQTLFVVHGMV